MATPTALPPAKDAKGLGPDLCFLVGKRTFVFGDGTGDGVGASLPVCNVPANVRVTHVLIDVTVAFNGTGDIADVGDGDDADGWIDTGEIAISGTNDFDSRDGAQPYASIGKRYTSADTVDILLETNSDTTTGSLTVWVYGHRDEGDE